MDENTPNTPPAGEQKAPESDGKSNTNQPAPQGNPQETAGATNNATPEVNLHGFTESELENMRVFFDNNGGFEGVKSRLSNPQKYANQQPQPEAQPQTQQPQPQAQPQPQPQPQPQTTNQVPEGYYSQSELGFDRYMSDLANSDKYRPLHDYISGDDGKQLLDDLKSFNIQPMDSQGNINVGGITKFLDLKVQTVPAQQDSVEPSSTPTADYIQVGDEIKSFDEAARVISQSHVLKAQGKPAHPAYDKALEFLKAQGKAK